MSFFDDILGGVAGAGLGLLTGGPVGAVAGGLGGFASAMGASNQRDWSADQAQKQMDFQERMSSTAWQRATADMRKAGINPMLAFMQGGASSPAGAIGTSSASPLSAAVGSAMDVQQVEKQMALMDQQIEKTRNEAGAANTDWVLKQIEAQALGRHLSAGDQTSVRDALVDAQLAGAQASASSAASQARLAARDARQGTSWLGRTLNWGRLALPAASTAAQAAYALPK